jgi:predicted pyridoxine 5'-phosphate oxidase superfamily flavin-nucleotide-binding protein
MYSPSSRELQDRFDTRRLADRLAEVKVHATFTPDDRAFVERLDMFFLATVDDEGRPTCSYKGGDPGFVSVLDERSLAFPSYDGNGMFLSLGNVAATRYVGLLFIDLEEPRRMRVEGRARIELDHPLLARHPEAQLLVVVEADRIYPNCARYIHKYELVERSRFVPHADRETPVPAWKQSAWAADVLPSQAQTASGLPHRDASYFEPGPLASFDPPAVVRGCIENGKRSLLLDVDALPPSFFDLSSGVAGELLHRLGLYGIRLASVVPDPSVHSAPFQSFLLETNRGRQARFFPTRREAVEWLGS